MITRCLLTFLFTAVTKVVRTSDVRIDVIRYVFHLSNVLLGFYTWHSILKQKQLISVYYNVCTLYKHLHPRAISHCLQCEYKMEAILQPSLTLIDIVFLFFTYFIV